MIVRLYDMLNNGTRKFITQCELSTCFPDDPEETQRTQEHLTKHGEIVVGGGAAPTFLIVRV